MPPYPKSKKETIKSLDAKLWKIFSKYIRLRDALATTGSIDYFKCCTCGRTLPFSKADCGHFIKRQFKSVKYDERNNHAQCRQCNKFKGGMEAEYYRFMINKYGLPAIEELELKRDYEKRKPYKVYPFEFKEKIEIYKKRLVEFK